MAHGQSYTMERGTRLPWIALPVGHAQGHSSMEINGRKELNEMAASFVSRFIDVCEFFIFFSLPACFMLEVQMTQSNWVL